MNKLLFTYLFVFTLIISKSILSQSITSTFGTNGVFSIKNSSSNYFTLSQSSGQVNIFKTLELEETVSSTKGVFYMGANRFMHVYGSHCMFIGENSGNFTLIGPWNTGFGSGTLTLITSGNSNSAFGNSVLGKCTTGSENSGYGVSSLMNITTGSGNSACGNSALSQNITGIENSAFGYQSIGGINSGDFNSGFGFKSLSLNLSGKWNAAFGCLSLSNNSTGTYNSVFGFNAGSIITVGSNLSCLGYNCQPTKDSAINQVTLGNSSVTILRCNVTAISSLSDRRDKRNIKDLTLGLDFLMKVKPRLYNWDKREWYQNGISDGTKMQETPTAGFIAQELDDAQTTAGAEWLNLVLKDNPEKWEATPGNLMPVIVKAVQELNMEIEESKIESENLLSKDKEFEERILKFEQMQNTLMDEAEMLRKNNTDLKEIKSVTK